MDLHALGFVDRADRIRRIGGGDTGKNAIGHFDQRYVETEFAGDRRGLKTDITATDDEKPMTRLHLLGQAIGIGLVAHRIDAIEITANRGRQTARRRPGANGEGFIWYLAAVEQLDHVLVTIDRLDRCRQADVDPVLAKPGFWPEQQSIEVHLAEQILLGKRRPLIRQDRLIAD